MKKYIYQDFLLDCPYSEICIDDVLWNDSAIPQNYDEPYNLFDWSDHKYIRSILLSELDTTVDTEEDFNEEVKKLQELSALIIINDRPLIDNIHIRSYSDATLKAFVYRFRKADIPCYVKMK